MSVDFDVLVVGGSANGLQAARVTAEAGLRVLVVEEHERPGYPEHCSGLFTVEGLQVIDSMPPKRIVQNNMVYGARLFAPNGKSLLVRKNEVHAIVVDRARFDEYLTNDASRKGATIWFNARALVPYHEKDTWHVTVKHKGEIKTITTRIIISADGWRGHFSRLLGFPVYTKNKVVHAAQAYMQDVEGLDRRYVEVYQTHEYAPGYFAWVIPMTDTTAKVGLGTTRKHAGKELQRMLHDNPLLSDRVKHAYTYYKTAGQIPYDGPIKQTVTDGAMIVGDAAGQVKPTTGGGVILGGLAARIAGETAVKAIKKGNWSIRGLLEYEQTWKHLLQWNFWAMKRVRKYLNALPDTRVNQLFNTLENPKIKTIIENAGHVDNQAQLIKILLKTPKLWPYYIKTTPQALSALL